MIFFYFFFFFYFYQFALPPFDVIVLSLHRRTSPAAPGRRGDCILFHEACCGTLVGKRRLAASSFLKWKSQPVILPPGNLLFRGSWPPVSTAWVRRPPPDGGIGPEALDCRDLRPGPLARAGAFEIIPPTPDTPVAIGSHRCGPIVLAISPLPGEFRRRDRNNLLHWRLVRGEPEWAEATSPLPEWLRACS